MVWFLTSQRINFSILVNACLGFEENENDIYTKSAQPVACLIIERSFQVIVLADCLNFLLDSSFFHSLELPKIALLELYPIVH